MLSFRLVGSVFLIYLVELSFTNNNSCANIFRFLKPELDITIIFGEVKSRTLGIFAFNLYRFIDSKQGQPIFDFKKNDTAFAKAASDPNVEAISTISIRRVCGT